jgi:hypothetical protein
VVMSAMQALYADIAGIGNWDQNRRWNSSDSSKLKI